MPKGYGGLRLTSPAQEDYLKAIHSLGEEGNAVPTSELATELGVSPASVSEMLGKLATLDLVTHDHYHGAKLTGAGAAIAVEMVRHHRLLETYLVEALGYSWDQVHQEADRLEHAISEVLEARMWEALGRPAFDPHGHPIPAPDGTIRLPAARPLHRVKAGHEVRISRISDHDPDKLRAIQRLRLRPGMSINVVEESLWEGPVRVQVGRTRASVPLGLARVVFVEDTRPKATQDRDG